ncbi:MAG TPA: sugar nucleotide-binding protein [Acidobacteriaceae bacterium]|jgi:dTDP-4-dehydrorhamnose reductase|nr:sugar nucleotide-binding protein [Acidobacteriaceae bacterium]
MPQNTLGPRPLVVGSAGQVGAALLKQLPPSALAATRAPNAANSPVSAAGSPIVDLIALAHNPSLATQLLDDLQPTSILCVGGATDVERCETDPTWANDTNAHGPAALATAARSIPFVFFSTDYVFPGTDETPGPYAEDAPTHPLSVYGRSKLAGERAILAAHPEALLIRTNVVFGPDRQCKNFLYTLHRLLSAGAVMRVPTDQLSTPTYNEDLAAATLALANSGHTGLFNISGRELLSRYDFALLAADILSLDASLLHPVLTAELNQRAPRPLRAGLRIDKLLRTLPHLTLRSTRQAIHDWQSTTNQQQLSEELSS